MPAPADTSPVEPFTPPPSWAPPTVPPDVTPPPVRGPEAPRGGGRSGAVWVAGTGAFLIVAAAALFVAVNWSALPLSLKIAMIGGLTGGVLYAGAALRSRLPGVAGVLTHLGAFLLPIDAGALTYRLGWDWKQRLLVEGLVGLVAFPVLARTTGSTVLRFASVAAAVTTATALGALTPVPAPVILACVAAVAVFVPDRSDRRYGALVAAIAGLGAVLGSAFAPVVDTTWLSASGWAVDSAAVALATGLVAGASLLVSARRDEDARVALLGAVVSLTGLAHALALTELTPQMRTLAAPAAFVFVEAVVLAASRDRFYARPAAKLGLLAEVPAAVGALGAIAVAVFATPFLTIPFIGSTLTAEVTAGTAYALLAAGWLLAWGRRALAGSSDEEAVTWVARGTSPGSASIVAAAWSLVAAVVFVTASPVAVAVTSVTLMAAGAFGRSLLVRGSVSLGTVVLCGTAITHPVIALAVVLPIAVAVAVHTLRATLTEPSIAQRTIAAVLVAPSFIAIAGAVAIAAELVAAPYLGLVIVVIGWAMAIALDESDTETADALRAAAGLGAIGALVEPSFVAVLVPVAAGVLVALDTVRLRGRIAWAGVVPALLGVATLAAAAELGTIGTGYAFGATAIVAGGLSLLFDDTRRDALVVTAFAATTISVVLVAEEPEALATLLLAAGLATAATGLAIQRLTVTQVGLGLATIGTWMRLGMADLQASELYALPVSLMLLVAGVQLRRKGEAVSSWMTFAPAVAITGLPAFFERLGGGSGWHAVAGGAVAVLAVGLGGYHRQAGPLFTGTALLLLLVGHEAFAVVAAVPTWAWLALGGSFLLGVGVLMERADTSPVDATRRLIEVIDERFE